MATAIIVNPPTWARCVAIGLASGARASAAFTALTWTAGKSDPSWLSHPAAKAVTSLMSAGEAVGDQLPKTPSRLAPAGLAPRFVAGAAGGAFLARRDGASLWTGAVIAAAAAGAGAFAGARFRALASARLGNDHPGALVEDAVVVGLAGYASR